MRLVLIFCFCHRNELLFFLIMCRVYALGLSGVVSWKTCGISWMMASAWSTFSSGISAMEATCPWIILFVHMSKCSASCLTGSTSPDDFLYAMHPAFASYPSMLVMIHVSSMPASVALGILTLSRNPGMVRNIICRTFRILSFAYRTLHGKVEVGW